jgi:hypothetical protein
VPAQTFFGANKQRLADALRQQNFALAELIIRGAMNKTRPTVPARSLARERMRGVRPEVAEDENGRDWPLEAGVR